jgi:hypothetical protein
MAYGLINDAVEKFRTARDQVKEKTSTHPLVGVLTYKTCLAHFRLNDYKSARFVPHLRREFFSPATDN